jgi:hypothetical protein
MDFNPAKTEPTIFHYTNAAGLVGIINNRGLWATGSNYLNDPTEVTFAAKALDTALRERLGDGCTDSDRTRAALNLLERYLDPHSPEQYREDRSFVTSFSRSDQSLTLWRLYAGRNGFCIGFDEGQLLRWIGHDFPTGDSKNLPRDEREEFDALQANYQLSAVIEDVSYGERHVEPILDAILAAPFDSQQPYLNEQALRTAMNNLSNIKHPAFEDEREARLIVRAEHHHALDTDVRVSASGVLVAHQTVVFPYEAVQSITIAPGANAPQQRRALQALMAHGGRAPYGHVDVRECGLPFVW